MFEGDELAEAMGVPLYYGLVEMFILGIYCIGAWKRGWTKAPPDVSLCTAISTSYEIVTAEKAELGQTIVVSPEVAAEIGGVDPGAAGTPDDEAFHYIKHVETFADSQNTNGNLQDEGIEMAFTGVRRTERPIRGRKEKSYIFLRPLVNSMGLGTNRRNPMAAVNEQEQQLTT
mmetsp:Transcript_4863/g.7086  ORF Transcript_4863/g.7086 Transcript_4863/m.7086 type:complete len:173 (+) Transcript_4863:915-1433(+)